MKLIKFHEFLYLSEERKAGDYNVATRTAADWYSWMIYKSVIFDAMFDLDEQEKSFKKILPDLKDKLYSICAPGELISSSKMEKSIKKMYQKTEWEDIVNSFFAARAQLEEYLTGLEDQGVVQ